VRKRRTPAELYWLYAIKQPSGCIEWNGARTNGGYGLITWLDGDKRRTTTAHRKVWEMKFGPIPPDTCVMHTCDNPPCVNVDHLKLGTQLDNVRDCISKGRANFWGKTRLAAGSQKVD